MKKIGFVVPWYGDAIPGGAEMETRGIVKHLHEAGVEVEILTTCVEKFSSDWNADFHKAGKTIESGIPVIRFPVRKRNTKEFDVINFEFMQGRMVSKKDEQIFLKEMINSPSLYKYIQKNQDEYSLFVMIPYMFGTTYYGSLICPEKTILIPCLHDESYAYMKSFKDAFSKVKGMIFHADPEKKLAERLYGVSGENFVQLGEGVDYNPNGDPNRFRKKYQIFEPFILYAGRKETGKKVDVLINYFAKFKERNHSNVKLVLIGGGEIDLPCEDIIDLGFVPAQDKYDAYAAASLFCNPSQMESFSLVVMESWLAERPVLVNGDCDVTTDFVIKTNGGLYYWNYPEFEACLQYLLSHVDIANQMGKNGKQYVLENFTWPVVTKRYKEYFERVSEQS